jgi:D-alanyl-D-alanine dipeptidase
MINSGWDFYQKEWWHYQLFNPKNYPVIENFAL